MTELRRRMIQSMTVRGFSPRTHKSYLTAVRGLAKHYRRPPDQLSAEEVQDEYRAMEESGTSLPPLRVIETELADNLKEKKESDRLEEWISDLQRRARIEVHEDVLYRD